MAARAIGASPTRVLARHLLPNLLPPVAALATQQAVALGQDDAFEPTRKRGRLTKLRKFFPGDNERFLRGVLRKVGVAQHGKRATEGHVLKANHQFAKGLTSRRGRTIRVSRPKYDLVDVFHLH